MERAHALNSRITSYFHVYPVQTIDEGIEKLTGVPAGKKDEDGNYPQGSVNYLVDMRLNELAKGLKDYFWVNGTAQKNTGSLTQSY